MTAIYRKEVGQLFRSVTGYVYLSVFLFAAGGYFALYQLLPANGNISQFFSRLTSGMIFLLPMLTMRAYAEEKKLKTMQLLMSTPVSAAAIAAGKFLAVLTVFMAGLAGSLLHVACLAVLGRLELPVVLGNYIGMAAVAGAFIAIGLFISLLTENQVSACIMTYVLVLVLWLMGMTATYMENPFWKQFVRQISLADRFAEFSMGIFDVSTIVYYWSIAAFFLLLTVLVTEQRRQGEGRAARRNLFLSISSGLILLISLNYCASELSRRLGGRWDMTAERLYELSEETKNILQQLEQEISIRVFAAKEDFLPLAAEILEQYQRQSRGKLRLEYIDPYASPSLPEKYIQRGYGIELGSVAVESGQYVKVLSLRDMFELDASGSTVQKIQCEQQITGAILYAAGTDKQTAGFITGHNEYACEAMRELLEQSNYQTRNIWLAAEAVREKELLVAAAPTSDFLKEEIDVLEQHLRNGGGLLVFLGVASAEVPNWRNFLEEWGIGWTDIVVAEPLHCANMDPLQIIPIYSAHSINQYFTKNQIYSVLPFCHALKPLFISQGGIKTQKLLYSSDRAYDSQKKEGERGPFTLAMTAEKKLDSGRARIVVMGSRGFLSDELLGQSSYGNAKLLAQIVNWCGETEQTLSIPAKNPGVISLSVTKGQAVILSGVFVLLLPLMVALTGAWRYYRRRHS